jgi:hypothetical protein
MGMKWREFDASRVKVLQEVGLDVSIMANKKLMDYGNKVRGRELWW